MLLKSLFSFTTKSCSANILVVQGSPCVNKGYHIFQSATSIHCSAGRLTFYMLNVLHDLQ